MFGKNETNHFCCLVSSSVLNSLKECLKNRYLTSCEMVRVYALDVRLTNEQSEVDNTLRT